MPTAKVTKNVSAAIGGGNVLCSTLISIKTKAWLYSFRCNPILFIPFYRISRCGSCTIAYRLSVCLMRIVSQRYMSCLSFVQGRSLTVHDQISTLCNQR